MTNEPTCTFAALSRCIESTALMGCGAALRDETTEAAYRELWAARRLMGCGAALRDETTEAAYRELWAARRLLEAARLLSGRARWDVEVDGEPSRAAVDKHDLVLLEAAALLASGERASTPDGFPHAGAEVVASGVCDAGFCPCHDGQRAPQGPLLDRAA